MMALLIREIYTIFLLSQAKTSFYRSKIVDTLPQICGDSAISSLGNRILLPFHLMSESSLSNNFNDFFSEKISMICNDLQSNPLPYPPHLSDALPEFSGDLLSNF
jgi:hypothetical protein